MTAPQHEFEMSEEQHARLLEACRPVPYMVFGGMLPRSPQQNANDAWKALGEEMDFEWQSVKPIPGAEGGRRFLATPTVKL